MMNMQPRLRVIGEPGPDALAEQEALDRVFFALSDPVRRQILERLDGQALLVSELATPFAISLQAVSRHIQVLVRAGLIQQQRSGRISKCSLDAGPLLDAAVWMNRYSKYWQQQFDVLAATLAEIDERKPKEPKEPKEPKMPKMPKMPKSARKRHGKRTSQRN